jgi:hypothetical protein
MDNKIDKRLEAALNKGLKKKQDASRKESDKRRDEEEAHKKEMRKWLPKAKAWVKEHLFEKIAEEESKGSNILILDEYVAGIPSEVIYKVLQKIKGLTVWSQNDVTWEDSDYGKLRENRLYIQWKSADPNLNRNDR